MNNPLKPVTTKDVTSLVALHNEEIALAVGTIAQAIAKKLPDPAALVDELIAISEPKATNRPLVARFFRRFNAVMKGGIESADH